MAGEKAKGATVYCTLEPCAHYGRTPPCTEALVAAQVARVVVGILDPYPKVNGKGVEYLRQNGIEVSTGYLEEIIKEDLKEFLERVKSGKQE
jgi:diaminohydroxyphosphoribosylaminopyrimidine deaminase/5-amino-6-(5-phosphoribosylamino)uracil reductase